MSRRRTTPRDRTISRRAGRLLREARESVGLSQSRIGKALGIGQSQVARIERGSGGLLVTHLISYCETINRTGKQHGYYVSPAGIMEEISSPIS